MSSDRVMPSDVYMLAAVGGRGVQSVLQWLWRSFPRHDLHPDVAEMVDGVELAWAVREGELAECAWVWWFGGGA